MKDQRLNNIVFGIKAIIKKKGGLIDYNGLVLNDNSSKSLNKYIYYLLL